jgi:hypothetical protein
MVFCLSYKVNSTNSIVNCDSVPVIDYKSSSICYFYSLPPVLKPPPFSVLVQYIMQVICVSLYQGFPRQ